jgi:hypothetical protein
VVADAATSTDPRCTPPPSPVAVATTTTQCPDDIDVRIVHRWQVPNADDACGPPPWVMHLRLPSAPVTQFFAGRDGTEGTPAYRPLTDAEVTANGVQLPTDPVWVFTANDAAPCQAAIGRVWVGATSAGGGEYAEIGVALHGCEMPREGDYVYAVAAAERPVACRYRAMSAVRNTGAPPPSVRARITQRACARPSCVFGWSLASLRVGDGSVEDAQGLYTFPQREVPECSYAHDWYHTVSWMPRVGAPWVRLTDAGPVTGVFYDGRGVRAVITDAVGEVRVYFTEGTDLGAMYARHSFRWFIGNDEDTGSWTIQPSCL